jgi:N-acetylglucosaminyl-diphospho-decaprenol L-rhamnosyltransferase
LLNSVTISIVSHNQFAMVSSLLDQLSINAHYISRVIITHNVKFHEKIDEEKYSFEVINLQNNSPLGFGENHNNAFQYCKTSFFCVMNPDIEIIDDPFTVLISCLNDSSIAVVAPLITNAEGVREDNARFFPTPFKIVNKVFFKKYDYYPINKDKEVDFPDWVAGMFLLFSANKYNDLNGFDKKYFLYYEDVDICTRIWRGGDKVAFTSRVSAIHNARRASHNDIQFLKFHITSALRFFIMNLGRYPKKVY